MKMMEIITIPVTDPQRAKAFYQQLGFEVIVETTGAHGQPWIQMALPGQDVSISLLTFHGIIAETESLDEEIQSLQAKGIEVGKIDNTPWGRFAWLKDPDGNGFCLHEK